MDKAFWRSRTFWGSVIFSAARVFFATPAERPPVVVEGIGTVLTAIGLRSAVAKAGTGQ